MCGIAGFAGFEDKVLVKEMTNSLAHRGPDDLGFYSDKGISIGHRRLSIIDLSKRATQPLCNEDGSIWVVVNGETYNFKELRSDLEKKGHRFKSDSDSEVIVHLYEEHGVDFLARVQGMFALALWDQGSKTLILARDRVGKKPLYYMVKDGHLFFASEIKALLKAEIPVRVDLKAMNYFMHLGFVPGEITMFKGVRKLKPGQLLIFKKGEIETKLYWDITDFSNIPNGENFFGKRVKELLLNSISERLVSDRPLGLFLSGGVDSSTVLFFLEEIIGASKLKTFSVGFDVDVEREKFNQDLSIARRTSEYFGTCHHEVMVSERDLIENFENVVYHMDEPIENETQIAMYMLAKYAKKEVAVVLSGNGGDELFGGYPRYSKYTKQPVKSAMDLVSRLPIDVKKFVVSNLLNKLFPEFEKIGKIAPEYYNKSFIADYVSRWYFNSKIPLGKRIMYIDLKNKLAENFLMTTDKMTMAHGLEQREPLLDFRLVEFAYRIPMKYKINCGETKFILKELGRKRLPAEVYQGKNYFFAPAAKWLRTEFGEVAEHYLSKEALKRAGYFDPVYVNNMLKRHVEVKEYNRSMIWKVLTFQAWYNTFVDEIL